MNSLNEIKVLLAFIRNADSDGTVDFTKTNISGELSSLKLNYNDLDKFLFEKSVEKILSYEEIGEDGFPPIIIASINNRTHTYLATKVSGVENEILDLQIRLTNILNFDPKELSKDISRTQAKLLLVKESIKGNDSLLSLNKPVDLISNHFDSVKRVAQAYEEIYKNIVKPVQEEGRNGIRATVRWAIISMLITVIVSILISNWQHVMKFFYS